jgi:hypothetical protein
MTDDRGGGQDDGEAVDVSSFFVMPEEVVQNRLEVRRNAVVEAGSNLT